MSEICSLHEQPDFKVYVLECPRPEETPPDPAASASPSEQSDSTPQYNSKVNEFYQAVESLKDKSTQKRIRPDTTQYLFYMGSQALIMLLKHLILNTPDSPHARTYIELFAIAVFGAFIYFYALETYQLGLGTLIKYQFHMDRVQLSSAMASLVGQYFIGLLGMGENAMAFRLAYPLWIFYLGSTTRIQVSLYRCHRFEALTTKALFLVEFVLTLVTLNHFLTFEQYHGEPFPDSAQSLSLLFLGAHAWVTANYYKLFSKFDGTSELRYDFQFENSLEAKIRTQIKQLKKKLLNMESPTDR